MCSLLENMSMQMQFRTHLALCSLRSQGAGFDAGCGVRRRRGGRSGETCCTNGCACSPDSGAGYRLSQKGAAGRGTAGCPNTAVRCQTLRMRTAMYWRSGMSMRMLPEKVPGSFSTVMFQVSMSSISKVQFSGRVQVRKAGRLKPK